MNFYTKLLYAMGKEKIKEKINSYLKLSLLPQDIFFPFCYDPTHQS